VAGKLSAAFRAAYSADACSALLPTAAFERGRAYAEEGRVLLRSVSANEVRAAVEGSLTYEVCLRLARGVASPTCTCPIGQTDAVCKHVVAVALVSTGTAGEGGQDAEPEPLRSYLNTLGRERLVDLLESAAANDGLLRERLRLDAARATVRGDRAALGASVKTYRRTIDSALRIRDFVSYREMPAYAQRAQSVIDALRGLLDDGHVEAVVELAERALDLLEEAAGHVDDSDGHLRPLAEQLSELHARGCEQAHVDPRKLAATLFARETGDDDELEAYYGAARTYREALGDIGLAEYRRRASAAWEKLPPLGPSEQPTRIDHRRFRLANVMETLAELSGDVDEHLAVLARDRSSPCQFIRIVEVLRAAHRFEAALEWAERGIAAFGVSADSRLVDVLAEEYHRAGRGADAVDLQWRAFDEDPDAESYRRLQSHAERIGVWAEMRPRALARVGEAVTQQIAAWAVPARPTEPARWGRRADASPLVDILLGEGDADAAWDEASRRGCSTALWIKLAHAREAEHPLDAAPIWQAEVERLIDAKRKDTYAAAVRLAEHVVDLLVAGGRHDSAVAYLDDLRIRHRAKRNLMTLLDQRLIEP
jgi:uncharacterized Zn finger protein